MFAELPHGAKPVTASASPDDAGGKTSFINRVFIVSHVLGQHRSRFERWNPAVYRLTKVALLVTVGVTIAFS